MSKAGSIPLAGTFPGVPGRNGFGRAQLVSSQLLYGSWNLPDREPPAKRGVLLRRVLRKEVASLAA